MRDLHRQVGGHADMDCLVDRIEQTVTLVAHVSGVDAARFS